MMIITKHWILVYRYIMILTKQYICTSVCHYQTLLLLEFVVMMILTNHPLSCSSNTRRMLRKLSLNWTTVGLTACPSTPSSLQWQTSEKLAAGNTRWGEWWHDLFGIMSLGWAETISLEKSKYGVGNCTKSWFGWSIKWWVVTLNVLENAIVNSVLKIKGYAHHEVPLNHKELLMQFISLYFRIVLGNALFKMREIHFPL